MTFRFKSLEFRSWLSIFGGLAQPILSQFYLL